MGALRGADNQASKGSKAGGKVELFNSGGFVAWK
jgi:hypothetical protein